MEVLDYFIVVRKQNPKEVLRGFWTGALVKGKPDLDKVELLPELRNPNFKIQAYRIKDEGMRLPISLLLMTKDQYRKEDQ